jgi:tRNA A37 methylthiotransferase MiaB
MKIAFATLGCKVNQYDTAIMEEEASNNSSTLSYSSLSIVPVFTYKTSFGIYKR